MHTPRSLATRTCVAAAALILVPAVCAAVARADAITVHERGIDVNPGSQNPCTGATGTVVDVNDIHFHITTRPDGTIEENGHNTADVTFTPDDPNQPTYHGHETYAFHATGNADAHTTTTTTFHIRMLGSDGSHLDLRETAHLTIGSDGATASFDRPRMRCS